MPTRDRSIAASSKNYRYSTNLQVVIDANSRVVVAIGLPLPGSRNACRAFTESGVDRACHGAPTIADGGYQSTGLLIPHRKRRGQTHLSPQQEAENAVHRRARARVEHGLSAGLPLGTVEGQRSRAALRVVVRATGLRRGRSGPDLCDRSAWETETARVLGIPGGTVKSRRRYALGSLLAMAATHDCEPSRHAHRDLS